MSERERFEAWATSENWIIDKDSFGDYVYSTASDGWAAWQAAIARSGQAASGSRQEARSDVQNGVGQPEAPNAAPLDELDRIRTALLDYFAAADVCWAEVCAEAAKHGIKSMQILPGQAKALEKFNELRRVIGPTVEVTQGAHPPARSGADPTGRTPTDYALEFAEYMAKGAEGLLEAINAEDNARLSVEEAWSTEIPSGDELEKLAQASESRGHFMRGLREKIYEFRKRRDRAIARSGAGSEEGGET